MSLALVRKELHEHSWVMGFAFVLSGFALGGFLQQGLVQGGRFAALTRYASSIGIFNILVVSNRLFAREYAGRTQLFLELLPISRFRVVATKWLLGCFWIALTLFAAWFVTLRWSRRSEVIAWHDALTTLYCVGAFSLSAWAFAAMAGVLGRYRYVAWVSLLVAAYCAKEVGGLPVHELPIVRLVGDDVAMARAAVPARAFAVAGAATLACILACLALALIGSGAIASALARRMTARERVFVFASCVGVPFAISNLTHKPDPPPFALREGEQVRGLHARVGVMRTRDLPAARAHALAAAIANDADTLIDALQLKDEPTIFVLVEHGLDRWALQRASLNGTRGIVLRAAPDAPPERLRAFILHALLLDATLHRAGKDDRHVLLDGLASYWVVKDDAAAQALLWLRAAASPIALSERGLTDWSASSEQLGDCVAESVAFALMDVLAHELGRARWLSLLRELFKRPHDNVRVLGEVAPATALREAGMPWRVLAGLAERARGAYALRVRETLARRPELVASTIASSSRARGSTLETNLVGAASHWALYAPLLPWTVSVAEPSRLDLRAARAVLPLSLPHAARVFVALELDDPTLRCPVRVLARRITLP